MCVITRKATQRCIKKKQKILNIDIHIQKNEPRSIPYTLHKH